MFSAERVAGSVMGGRIGGVCVAREFVSVGGGYVKGGFRIASSGNVLGVVQVKGWGVSRCVIVWVGVFSALYVGVGISSWSGVRSPCFERRAVGASRPVGPFTNCIIYVDLFPVAASVVVTFFLLSICGLIMLCGCVVRYFPGSVWV